MRHRLQFVAKLLERDPVGTHEGREGAKPMAEFLCRFASRLGCGSFNHLSCATVPEIQPAFVREQPVGRGDRIEVNPKIGGPATEGSTVTGFFAGCQLDA